MAAQGKRAGKREEEEGGDFIDGVGRYQRRHRRHLLPVLSSSVMVVVSHGRRQTLSAPSAPGVAPVGAVGASPAASAAAS
ncbi:MAG: hypothetical protein SOZ43_00245, partial [Eubacteriales bacterium]|nr:hypothetical protein [Eubacteriales bacterium]